MLEDKSVETSIKQDKRNRKFWVGPQESRPPCKFSQDCQSKLSSNNTWANTWRRWGRECWDLCGRRTFQAEESPVLSEECPACSKTGWNEESQKNFWERNVIIWLPFKSLTLLLCWEQSIGGQDENREDCCINIQTDVAWCPTELKAFLYKKKSSC